MTFDFVSGGRLKRRRTGSRTRRTEVVERSADAVTAPRVLGFGDLLDRLGRRLRRSVREQRAKPLRRSWRKSSPRRTPSTDWTLDSSSCRLARRLRRMGEVSAAFIKIGYPTTMSYPLVRGRPDCNAHADLRITSSPRSWRRRVSTWGRYFTFVIIGVITTRLLRRRLARPRDELELAVSEDGSSRCRATRSVADLRSGLFSGASSGVRSTPP